MADNNGNNSNNNKNGVMIYSLGGAFLISLVTEIVTANHYWKVLSGVALVAIVGIGFVAWSQFWSTAWAVLERQDLAVKRVAYGASLFVTMVMIVNAGFILYTRNKENREDVKQRQSVVRLQMTAATLKGLDPEIARELLKQQEQQQLREWEGQQRTQVMNTTGRKEETSLADIAEGYMSFWVFIIPFAAATLAKFIVLAMISLPGGASGYLPWGGGKKPAGTGGGGEPGPQKDQSGGGGRRPGFDLGSPAPSGAMATGLDPNNRPPGRGSFSPGRAPLGND
ncbi:MAG TPA: hypothetical protein VJ302_31965 [Blastocatellia bacterium]|nr:hypothetical protein [Blastocatellia bacterium]